MKEISDQASHLDAVRTRRIRLAIILGSLSAIGPLSIDMYLPSLPTITSDLGTITSLTQLSLTACLLGLALGQLFAGPLSDIHGRRIPLIIGLFIYSLSSLLCAFSPSVGMLICLRFVQGVAGAAGIVISRAIVRDLYAGSELTKFFSLLMLINGIAPIMAPIFGGQLLRFTSWHGVFVVLALLGLAMLIAVIFGLPETLAAERRTAGGARDIFTTFIRLLKNTTFVGYALTQASVYAAMFAYISGSPFVLQDVYGVSPQTFSYIFALNGLGIILASQLTGRLAGKVSETRLLIWGVSVAAFGAVWLLVMLVQGAGLIAVMLPLFLVVSCVGIVNPTAFSLAMQDQGRTSGSAAALLGVIPMIAGALVAPLVGIAGSDHALPMGLAIAICNVGALFSFLILVNKKTG